MYKIYQVHNGTKKGHELPLVSFDFWAGQRFFMLSSHLLMRSVSTPAMTAIKRSTRFCIMATSFPPIDWREAVDFIIIS